MELTEEDWFPMTVDISAMPCSSSLIQFSNSSSSIEGSMAALDASPEGVEEKAEWKEEDRERERERERKEEEEEMK